MPDVKRKLLNAMQCNAAKFGIVARICVMKREPNPHLAFLFFYFNVLLLVYHSNQGASDFLVILNLLCDVIIMRKMF